MFPSCEELTAVVMTAVLGGMFNILGYVGFMSGVGGRQGWISDMGIDGPTFVSKSDLF